MTSLLKRTAEYGRNDKCIVNKVQGIFKGHDLDSLFNDDYDAQRKSISALTQQIKSLEYHKIQAYLQKLEAVIRPLVITKQRRIARHESDFLTWDEITEMYHKGIQFGAHGVNHSILTKRDVDIDFELKYSKQEIENRLGITINSMSYPNGDYSEKIIQKVAYHGYKIGFGTEFGYNSHFINPYNVKRINVHEEACSTIPLFLCRILGLW